MNIPMSPMVDFLVDLLNTPSPTGYTTEAILLCEQAFSALRIDGLSLRQTPKGALLLRWQGQHDDAPRGLTAHVDTLGLMVREVKANGTLKVTPLGGLLLNGAEFENVTVRTHDDRRYRGTFMLINPSVHVNRDAAEAKRTPETMEVRLDERVSSEAETRALGIEVGDFIFIDPRVEQTSSGFIKSRFLDDKASVACVYGALLALRQAGHRPQQTTHILIANYEEVGHGGAHGFPPDLAELVAIDMGALGSGQNGDEFSTSICAKDSGGPYHYELTAKLRALAQAHDIAHKIDIYPHYSSDGTAYWRSGGGAAVALIGPGVASSHGYERTHRDALIHSAHLIACYLLSD
ncbi:MAG: M42 family metallopeptidase [Anaerolineae bacterium]|nr:M42 family metallopeptidase [Anaerolineae bacterium]MDW8173523.1 M42 family metallopeptidase [Anaerolineae bacterium]